MPSFLYSREVRLTATSVYQAVGDTLERLALQSQTDAISLSTSIGSASPVINVPIEITVMTRAPEDLSITFTIKARSATKLFPTFKGTFHALAMSSARTTVRLRGAYRAPLGLIGATIDAAGLHKLAEEGLLQLFRRVADESVAAIRDHATRDHAVRL
jgi:hypothetical protein